MGVVHRSQGKLAPASPTVRSEVDIVIGVAKASVGDLPQLRWDDMADYDRVRDVVERVVVGFDAFNARVRASDGFTLKNTAREREWNTAGGRAAFSVVDVPRWQLADDQLLLMTIRSHDQFNTTVYEESDRYRGIYSRRQILFISAADLEARGLTDGDVVTIKSHYQGVVREAAGFALVAYDLPKGSVAGYFPELNVLVPLESRARESHTPTSKAVVVTLHR